MPTRPATSPAARTPRHSERGSIVLIVAILAVMVLGFIGLAVDGSHVASAAGQLQDAADAAALAATASLAAEAPLGGSQGTYAVSRQKAIDVAAANIAAGAAVQLKPNFGNLDNGDIVVGKWSTIAHTFTPSISSPNAVKIVAKRTSDSLGGSLPLAFGGPFQSTMADVARSSIAVFKASANPLIHVLNPTDSHAMHMNGNPTLDVSAGAVQVNSADSCALHGNGNPTIVAGTVNVVGGACTPSDMIEGNLHTGAPFLADPLADILPTTSAWDSLKAGMPKPQGVNGKISSSGTFTPGYYPKGLDIKNSTSVTLMPGTYMFGTTVDLTGQSHVMGAGVTILVDKDVTLRIRGGAEVSLTPPASGDLQGLALMFHRQTTDSQACSIGGTGALSFEGSLYVPKGGMDLGGTGALQTFGQLVCDTLSVSGTSDITGVNIVPAETGAAVQLVQ